MSGNSRTDQHIARWLEALANVTIGGTEPVNAERIAVMTSFLAMDGLPLEAYCQRSLHAAAQGQRFFPAYDDVRKAVTAWWEANRTPTERQLPSPITSDMNAMDRAWVAFWHKRRAEIFAGTGSQQAAHVAMDNLTSLVRDQSLKAWSHVTGERESQARTPTESEVSHVAKLLRPEPTAGQRRYEVVEPPPPFRDVTAKGDDLDRMRGKTVPQRAVVTDCGEWA